MSKQYSCDMIQDLLALYHDGVCSEDSRAAVEQHLSQCERCSRTARLLDNTELESNIADQAQGVIKNHKKKQRRKLIIIISAALVIIAAVVFLGVIRPRVELNKLINEYLPEIGEGAEYFTEYDMTDDSLITLETDALSVDIPADYVQEDIGELDAVMYHAPDNDDRAIIIVTSHTDLSEINMLDRTQYEDLTDEEYENIIPYLKDWFGSLGHGLPDSAYGTYKCAYMLSDDDRSFWNIGQNIAFGIMGLMKETLAIMGEEIYIYETDDKCGFIFVTAPKDDRSYYRVTADMYSTDDLNAPHNIIIKSASLEEAYAIINSIEFK